jgi:hypothetical protein
VSDGSHDRTRGSRQFRIERGCSGIHTEPSGRGCAQPCFRSQPRGAQQAPDAEDSGPGQDPQLVAAGEVGGNEFFSPRPGAPFNYRTPEARLIHTSLYRTCSRVNGL